MSDKPMTEYLEYKYNDVSDVAANVGDPRGGIRNSREIHRYLLYIYESLANCYISPPV